MQFIERIWPSFCSTFLHSTTCKQQTIAARSFIFVTLDDEHCVRHTKNASIHAAAGEVAA